MRSGAKTGLITLFFLIGCGGGDGGSPPPPAPPAPAAFTQADLVGTWNGIQAETGAPNQFWEIGSVTIDAAGNLFRNGSQDSLGNTNGPADLQVRITIDGSGIISTYDTSGVTPVRDPSAHGTLSASKKVLVQTTTNPMTEGLIIFQKQDPLVSYGNSDIWGKSFVYHGLYLGTGNVWVYGDGSVNATGQLTFTSMVGPSGLLPVPQPNFATLSANMQGIVAGDANFGFLGFLTTDKYTIFGVMDTIAALPGPNPMFVVINILGASYTQADMGGTWWYHMLQNNPAAWGRGKFAVDNTTGAVTYDNTTTFNSFGPVTNATNDVLSINSTGTITNPNVASYHGQLSATKNLYVRTRTGTAQGYSISISVK